MHQTLQQLDRVKRIDDERKARQATIAAFRAALTEKTVRVYHPGEQFEQTSFKLTVRVNLEFLREDENCPSKIDNEAIAEAVADYLESWGNAELPIEVGEVVITGSGIVFDDYPYLGFEASVNGD